MATHAVHKFWLKISAITVGFFGPVLTLGTIPALNEPARLGLALLTWPVDGFPTFEPPEMWFLAALTGGFLVGWGVMIWCMSIWLHDVAPEAVRKSLVVSVCAWFIIDSTGSITSGNWPNALWNVLVILIIIGPMWQPATIQSSS